MSIRLGIFGAGRIGTLFLRKLALSGALGRDFEIAAVLDREADAENLAGLLRHDTTHGAFPLGVRAEKNSVRLMGRAFPVVTSGGNPVQAGWERYGAEWVLDATGAFLSAPLLEGHLTAGARRVIVSGPAKGVRTLVYGVNHESFSPETDRLVSASSCTVNCLAPVCQALKREGIGILRGVTTAVHASNSGQNLLDGAAQGGWRTGRAAFANIIPFATKSPEQVAEVIPTLAGKLRGIAYRVPVNDMAAVIFDFEPSQPSDIREVLSALERASQSYLGGVLGLEREPQVSSMRIGDPRSAVVDVRATLETNPEGKSGLLRLVLWYDNEWGYVSRLADLGTYMAAAETVAQRRVYGEYEERAGRFTRRNRTYAGSRKIRQIRTGRPGFVGRLRVGGNGGVSPHEIRP